MSARIVRYVVEAHGHVEVLIRYRLGQEVLRLISDHNVQAMADEVVADAVRASCDTHGPGRQGSLSTASSNREFFNL